jgi:hypothetical protein
VFERIIGQSLFSPGGSGDSPRPCLGNRGTFSAPGQRRNYAPIGGITVQGNRFSAMCLVAVSGLFFCLPKGLTPAEANQAQPGFPKNPSSTNMGIRWI